MALTNDVDRESLRPSPLCAYQRPVIVAPSHDPPRNSEAAGGHRPPAASSDNAVGYPLAPWNYLRYVARYAKELSITNCSVHSRLLSIGADPM